MNLSICLRINGHIEARNYPLFKTRPVYTMTTAPKEVPRRLGFRSGKRNQSSSAALGLLSWLGPNPVTPNSPYCHTISPFESTRITRLSTQPDLLQFVVAPAGIPVPDISVKFPTRSASFVPTIAFAEVSPGPFPNCQTILPAGSISMTRLLNWSVMRMLPGRLNSLETCPFDTVPDNKMTPPINSDAAMRPNECELFMVTPFTLTHLKPHCVASSTSTFVCNL